MYCSQDKIAECLEKGQLCNLDTGNCVPEGAIAMQKMEVDRDEGVTWKKGVKSYVYGREIYSKPKKREVDDEIPSEIGDLLDMTVFGPEGPSKEIEDLPLEMKWEIALKMDCKDIIQLCATSSIMMQICNSDEFWIRKIRLDYGEEEVDRVHGLAEGKEIYPYYKRYCKNEIISISELKNREDYDEMLERFQYYIVENKSPFGPSRTTFIPPEIGKLTDLTKLNYYGNYLTYLPPEIGKLGNLELLGLGKNELTSLPSEIGKLSKLKELYIKDNQLTSLPPEIGNLSNLEELGLWGNKLTSLPQEIGNLSNLKELDLSENELTSLPQEIGNLSNLKELYFGYNKLTSLPQEIGKLSKLELLYLNYNKLTSLPQEIGKLSKLELLDLGGNSINDDDPVVKTLRLKGVRINL